jgi:hypothetical protein
MPRLAITAGPAAVVSATQEISCAFTGDVAGEESCPSSTSFHRAAKSNADRDLERGGDVHLFAFHRTRPLPRAGVDVVGGDTVVPAVRREGGEVVLGFVPSAGRPVGGRHHDERLVVERQLVGSTRRSSRRRAPSADRPQCSAALAKASGVLLERL